MVLILCGSGTKRSDMVLPLTLGRCSRFGQWQWNDNRIEYWLLAANWFSQGAMSLSRRLNAVSASTFRVVPVFGTYLCGLQCWHFFWFERPVTNNTLPLVLMATRLILKCNWPLLAMTFWDSTLQLWSQNRAELVSELGHLGEPSNFLNWSWLCLDVLLGDLLIWSLW